MKLVCLICVTFVLFDEFIAIENVTSPFILYNNVISEDEMYDMRRYSFDQVIFPGTKWCGPGNNARNDNDFGVLRNVDRCCYNHDHCDFDAIEPGQRRHGLNNDTPFPKLLCSCEKELFRCLKREGGYAANTVGKMYSVGNTQCYKLAYPIVHCNRYQHKYFMRRCVDYILDSSQPKEYQFFDTPFFSSSDEYEFKKSVTEIENYNQI